LKIIKPNKQECTKIVPWKQYVYPNESLSCHPFPQNHELRAPDHPANFDVPFWMRFFTLKISSNRQRFAERPSHEKWNKNGKITARSFAVVFICLY